MFLVVFGLMVFLGFNFYQLFRPLIEAIVSEIAKFTNPENK